jgi:ceramide glucosyltransferase
LNFALVSRFLALLGFLSFALTFWRWAVAARFPLHRRAAAPTPPPLPGCTLLKPLKGADAETKSCLRSWLTQVYPGPVQILFGADSADDPVCALVRELLAEFPGLDARLVLCEQRLGVNNKVSTLRQLQPLIGHPLVIISDADVSVPRDFLANIAPLLADPQTGLVNCFYRLANPSTSAMRWESISINSDFWSSVLQAHSLEKVDFALGAVMSLPLAQLQAIGGFATLADVLADDYELGRQVARLGKRIVISTEVVDCHETPRNWRQTWTHQARWARTIRACQPVLYFFSVLENATVWPLLWLLVNAWSWLATGTGGAHLCQVFEICLGFFIFRIATALHQEWRLTRSTGHFRWFWMAPVKDVLNFAVWAAAFTGNHVQWRGQRYRIMAGGKLEKMN